MNIHVIFIEHFVRSFLEIKTSVYAQRYQFW